MKHSVNEEWRHCVVPYTRYMVSNFGRVKNHNGLILALQKTRWGYLRVPFCYKGKSKIFYVHRLVAFAFCEGFKPGMEVDHINRVKTDNRAANLRWVTSSENKRNNKGHGTPILCFKDGTTAPVGIYRSCYVLEKLEGGKPFTHMSKGMKFHGMRLVAINLEDYECITELMKGGYDLRNAWVEHFTSLRL